MKLLHPNTDSVYDKALFYEPELPFCQANWQSKSYDTLYFLLIHVFTCFVLPFSIIAVCNVEMWRSVLKVETGVNSASSQSRTCLNATGSCLREIQRQRKLRILKLFTGLTFVFFAFWLPLYVIMFRVKFFYTDSFSGSEFEQQLIHSLIPLSQLLGSCNSCVNPVLYAFLNQKFRESCTLLCSWCSRSGTPTVTIATRDEYHSVANNVAAEVAVASTAV